jgi:hypothetical protein
LEHFRTRRIPTSVKKTHQNKNLSSSNANIEAEGLIPARDRRSFEKFPRLIAENRDEKNGRGREYRQANPGLST